MCPLQEEGVLQHRLGHLPVSARHGEDKTWLSTGRGALTSQSLCPGGTAGVLPTPPAVGTQYTRPGRR